MRQLGELQVKILAVLSFAQILGAASATSPPPTPAPEVLVCLGRIAQAGTSATYLAQSETSKLLARADIRVLYDRVQAMVSPAHEPHLLAYVLAHEIVHILEGTGRHSATGIMKPNGRLKTIPISFPEN
jgi:hypothetical protein